MERATALCWRLMTLRLQSWAFTPGNRLQLLRASHGDWSEYIIVLVHGDHCNESWTIACYDLRHANRLNRNDV